jgi:hypothetical protein
MMAARQLRKILRRPTYVVYLFVQPVIFVLLFRYVFGGAIDTGDVGYVDFLMPGIITMTAPRLADRAAADLRARIAIAP